MTIYLFLLNLEISVIEVWTKQNKIYLYLLYLLLFTYKYFLIYKIYFFNFLFSLIIFLQLQVLLEHFIIDLIHT